MAPVFMFPGDSRSVKKYHIYDVPAAMRRRLATHSMACFAIASLTRIRPPAIAGQSARQEALGQPARVHDKL